MLDALGPGDGEVDRLTARVGEPPETRLRERDESLGSIAARVAEENRSGAESSAGSEPLDEALSLEGADEARGRALREAGTCGQLADRRRLGRFDDADE
jgi:hypothetical protein